MMSVDKNSRTFSRQMGAIVYICCNLDCLSLLGGSPYPGMEGKTVPGWLKLGYRMPKPVHIDDKLYEFLQILLDFRTVYVHLYIALIPSWCPFFRNFLALIKTSTIVYFVSTHANLFSIMSTSPFSWWELSTAIIIRLKTNLLFVSDIKWC